MRSNTRISAITEYTFQFRVGFPFILTYFSVFNSSTTNPNQLHVSKVSGDGFRQILREKITFKVVQFQAVKRFWPAARSSEKSYDDVSSWRSDALKLYWSQLWGVIAA